MESREEFENWVKKNYVGLYMTDQPEVCPECGCRTYFEQIDETYQRHICKG